MVKIKIAHNGTIIADNVKELKGNLEKARGLLFRKRIAKNEAFLFIFDKEDYWDFHMFFMFYPIDILWLDKNKVIVDSVKNFKPWRFHRPKRKSKFVIELPSGTIERFNINKGDKLEF
ncbi:MAG: uncharacterized protein PWQ28_462 [Candidatus Woesearchaeota archaeon]|nr:uncharacterized protein [Candidatus Woesearchaeota archaeon]